MPGTIRNTGCLVAARRRTSSGESAVTSPKNAPTSQPHRRRYERSTATRTASSVTSTPSNGSTRRPTVRRPRPTAGGYAPLRVATRRDEVSLAVECQHVDGRGPPFSGLTSSHGEHSASPQAHPDSGEGLHDVVEQPRRTPGGEVPRGSGHEVRPFRSEDSSEGREEPREKSPREERCSPLRAVNTTHRRMTRAVLSFRISALA